jgi:hypothetical protein
MQKMCQNCTRHYNYTIEHLRKKTTYTAMEGEYVRRVEAVIIGKVLE